MLFYVVGLLLFVLILLYSTRWYWWAPKRIDPSGKVILVTGAASGFGLCTTKQLVEKGCFVLAVDINHDALNMHFGTQKDVRTFKCDISKTEDVERLFEEVKQVLEKERGGQSLFGLVNNAGIAIKPMPILDVPEETLKRVIEINTFGMWRMTKAFFSCLETKAVDKACIVNITSVAGLMSGSFSGVYSMSKFAAEAFTDCLRRELWGTGIRVSIVEPYLSNTAIIGALMDKEGIETSPYKLRIEKAIQFLQKTKMLPPETIANCICENLFTSPCKTRTIVAFWPDWIFVFLICRVLPDSVTDFLIGLNNRKAK